MFNALIFPYFERPCHPLQDHWQEIGDRVVRQAIAYQPIIRFNSVNIALKLRS